MSKDKYFAVLIESFNFSNSSSVFHNPFIFLDFAKYDM
jgi:hypothetical protein